MQSVRAHSKVKYHFSSGESLTGTGFAHMGKLLISENKMALLMCLYKIGAVMR